MKRGSIYVIYRAGDPYGKQLRSMPGVQLVINLQVFGLLTLN